MKPPVLPNAVIAGLGRSGTTSLFQYLLEHPDVCGSKRKETKYFEPAVFGQELAPLHEYSAFFDHYAGEAVILEATPGYFAGGLEVARLIRSTLGDDARVVIVLREPASRLVSFYNLAISRLLIDRSVTLEQYVALCEQSPAVSVTRDAGSRLYQGYYGGFYAEPLIDWLGVFGDRLRVLFFDDLENDPIRFMVETSGWLGLDPDFYRDRSFAVQNPSRHYRSRMLHRVANGLSDGAEFALRRHPEVKNSLRRMYLRLNSPTLSAGVGDDILERLRQTYAESNARVHDELLLAGYRGLPAWLAPSR